MAPRSQYDRNLTIQIIGGGSKVSFTFPIKPGEFQAEVPARVSTVQTLEGVYQDHGGLGVEKLSYQGHTGWRSRPPNNVDGFQVFQNLYQKVYKEYHNRIGRLGDPEQVKCMVIDDLYDTVYRVSLDDFQPTKSRSNPLLYNYTIHMTVQTTTSDGRKATDYSQLPSTYTNPKQISKRIQLSVNAVKILSVQPSKTQRTYKVVAGDNLWKIAVVYYRDGSQYHKIAQANHISPPYIINIGQVLTIPE